MKIPMECDVNGNGVKFHSSRVLIFAVFTYKIEGVIPWI